MAPHSKLGMDQQGKTEWWLPLAVVSGVVVALSLALALVLGERTGEKETAAAPLSSRIGLAARAALVALGSSEEDFEGARTELLEVLETRDNRLPEDTRTALSESLDIIEAEIAAISDELTRDPENKRLARLLAAAYRRELELLQRAATLPTIGHPASDS